MTCMEPTCKIVENEEELRQAHSIRREVFIVGQGVPESLEMDEQDADALHCLCRTDGIPLGTGRVEFLDEGKKMGRVAVLEQYRGRGIGRLIVLFLMEESGKRSEGRIFANVQLEAVDFYGKLGFVGEGDTFNEAGIEHVRMVLGEENH